MYLTKMSFLKNEGQEGKTGPVWGWGPVGGGGHKEKVKKGKYDGSFLLVLFFGSTGI
jgi:hypothetical protein